MKEMIGNNLVEVIERGDAGSFILEVCGSCPLATAK